MKILPVRCLFLRHGKVLMFRSQTAPYVAFGKVFVKHPSYLLVKTLIYCREAFGHVLMHAGLRNAEVLRRGAHGATRFHNVFTLFKYAHMNI